MTLPIPKYSKDDVLLLEQLMEAGTYRGVIDRRYPLEDVVEATRYVETGQKTGNVVLTVTREHRAIAASDRRVTPVTLGDDERAPRGL